MGETERDRGIVEEILRGVILPTPIAEMCQFLHDSTMRVMERVNQNAEFIKALFTLQLEYQEEREAMLKELINLKSRLLALEEERNGSKRNTDKH